MDWSLSSADGVARDRLYRARDLAVINRAFPGLNEQQAMETDNRLEYEISWVLQKFQQATPLDGIIRECTFYRRSPQASPPLEREGHEKEYEPE
ncbi:hypothetical protein [Sulfobacillus harzensis]|uniref:Uncharacterized protein n=1 Tax=Sulfobacillus harzensis TaxID=2729629 RepID=A0A7Y0L475_9FIRM|nr:hypothetical protein [Sulfobacillus harzensis]NMP22642.1 hypothetical protein [Sulfobacillus harzensis]